MTGRKRIFDIACACTGLALFAPVIATLGAAVWLESGGPIVFVQERIGEGGRPFRLVKLRSMTDGRVTRVGRWIRATGLDETLQFVHVLRGEMSMVGPRPMTADDLRRLGWLGTAREDYRPGITGPAQVWAPPSEAWLAADLADDGGVATDAALVIVSFAINVAGKTRVRRWLCAMPAPVRAALRQAQAAPDRRPAEVMPSPVAARR